jgi:uncharacterized SAM-binding protein YcdF (DUF218 family)
MTSASRGAAADPDAPLSGPGVGHAGAGGHGGDEAIEATDRERPRRRWSRRRKVVVAALGTVLLALAYVVGTFIQVWQASGRDAARPAEAIVVLGAAQYDGRPSPALQGRLDHALELYRDDIAPVIVVTGGRQQGDRFTESTVGYNFLRSHGVPDSSIRKEVQGHTTYESLASVARFLRKEGIDDVVLVSGPAHSKRLSGIASQVGLHAAISPADGSPSLGSLVRETLAVSMGRIVGYRRLERLDQ